MTLITSLYSAINTVSFHLVIFKLQLASESTRGIKRVQDLMSSVFDFQVWDGDSDPASLPATIQVLMILKVQGPQSNKGDSRT